MDNKSYTLNGVDYSLKRLTLRESEEVSAILSQVRIEENKIYGSFKSGDMDKLLRLILKRDDEKPIVKGEFNDAFEDDLSKIVLDFFLSRWLSTVNTAANLSVSMTSIPPLSTRLDA